MSKLIKLVSSALALALVLNITFPAYASNPTSEMSTEDQIQQEITFRQQELYEVIYEQLEAQNALELIGEFEAILYPNIESQVQAEFGGVQPIGDDDEQRAPYGGVVTYLSPIDGYQPSEVAITGLDYNNSYYYVLSSNSFTIGSIVETILGYIPYIGACASLAFSIRSWSTALSNNKILEADGYAQITNVYSPEFDTEASVVTGWDNYPYLYSSVSDAQNYTLTRFQEYNPFEN